MKLERTFDPRDALRHGASELRTTLARGGAQGSPAQRAPPVELMLGALTRTHVPQRDGVRRHFARQ